MNRARQTASVPFGDDSPLPPPVFHVLCSFRPPLLCPQRPPGGFFFCPPAEDSEDSEDSEDQEDIEDARQE